nr:hypothetical protein I308_03516 [Cryptococcus tetragattii IND107]
MEVMEAKAWRRRGGDISFKIPCTILENQIAEEHEFYQVDLVLILPGKLSFVTFMTSYSSTSIILGRILRYTPSPLLSTSPISSSATLRTSGFSPLTSHSLMTPKCFATGLGQITKNGLSKARAGSLTGSSGNG